ncbi:hypothetical protein MMPV_007976 [Pyropia vietnamensis]
MAPPSVPAFAGLCPAAAAPGRALRVGGSRRPRRAAVSPVMKLSNPAAAGSGGTADATAAPVPPDDDDAEDLFPLVSAGTPAAAALWSNATRDVPMAELHDNNNLSEAEMAALRSEWDSANEGARLTRTDVVAPTDAMSFFRARAGTWASWRVTHHLAFRRSETGESAIKMEVLPASDERIVSLCADNGVAPDEVEGGCHVTWQATMAWDAEGENHAGETVFALVPEKGSDGARGRMLRDRGYAEIVPIAGTYFMDAAGGLNLITPYDGGEVVERFVFDGPDIVHRASTVCRFGGMGTATFSTERRMECSPPVADVVFNHDMLVQGGPGLSPDDGSLDGSEGGIAGGSSVGGKTFQSRLGAAAAARAAAASGGKPSARSAFATGFGRAEAPPAAGVAGAEPVAAESAAVADSVAAAAQKVGIDLSKVPPSMREDFIASLNREK